MTECKSVFLFEELLEESVGLRCTWRDQRLVRSVAPEAARSFTKMTKINVNFEIDSQIFLPNSDIGGIILYAHEGDPPHGSVTPTLSFYTQDARIHIRRNLKKKLQYDLPWN